MSKKSLPINVSNRQRQLRLNTRPLEEFLQCVAARLGVESGFSVALVSDERMRTYNRKYAGKNAATDVLAFPCDELWPGEDSYSGDIVVSVETAFRHAPQGLLRELKVLSLHGLLHLLGYDHERDEGEMATFESQLRKEFGLGS